MKPSWKSGWTEYKSQKIERRAMKYHQVQYGHGNHELPASVVTVTKPILHWSSQQSGGNENNAKLNYG